MFYHQCPATPMTPGAGVYPKARLVLELFWPAWVRGIHAIRTTSCAAATLIREGTAPRARGEGSRLFSSEMSESWV